MRGDFVMAFGPADDRFLRYQIKAIRRFQRLREPRTREEAQRLALEWIARFACDARQRWIEHASGRTAGGRHS